MATGKRTNNRNRFCSENIIYVPATNRKNRFKFTLSIESRVNIIYSITVGSASVEAEWKTVEVVKTDQGQCLVSTM